MNDKIDPTHPEVAQYLKDEKQALATSQPKACLPANAGSVKGAEWSDTQHIEWLGWEGTDVDRMDRVMTYWGEGETLRGALWHAIQEDHRPLPKKRPATQSAQGEDTKRLRLLEWLGETAFFPDWDDNGFWHAKVHGQRVIGTTLTEFCDNALAARAATPSTQSK